MSEQRHLLFIDDEDIVLRSCHRVFKNAGYAIDTARSGEEGLHKAAGARYDVIVTDLKMPGIDGLEVLRRLKRDKPQQVVVVFTGYANVTTARESLKLGAFDYVPKPFTAQELRDVVANALKKADDDKSTAMLDLMAIVAHEFKSPVATVHVTAETLYRGYFGNLSPEQQHSLETVLRNCQYLEDIIRSYMDLTRMELNNLEFTPHPLDVAREVVEPVVNTPEYQENLKKMRLVTHVEEVPKVNGDANLLKIVVNNLVNNEGPGIPRSDIETRLFTRFGRLKQKGTEGVKGSGLGLYICKQIVEKHGGRIRVESESGKFARFTLELTTVQGDHA
jgi:signal transduction histidine kinase